MRIAIQLSGQPRFTGDFDLFLKNLTGYEQADWFCYITNNNADVPAFKLPVDHWKTFDQKLAIDKIQSHLPPNNFIRSFEISDCEQVALPNVPDGCPDALYKMWYNIYKSNQLRIAYEQSNNIEYDMIIRVRPDIGLENELNLNSYKDIDLDTTIIFPQNHWAGHLGVVPPSPQACDQFAISNGRSMNIYSDLIHHIESYPYTKDRYMWHNEANLAHHLVLNNITTTPGNFIVSLRKYPTSNNNWA